MMGRAWLDCVAIFGLLTLTTRRSSPRSTLCGGNSRFRQNLSGVAGTLPLVKSWVHGCESDGFKLHELKKRQELFELPSEVIVCELHRGELSEPNTEWVMAATTPAATRYG
jgi:hypothetical protein